MAPDDSIRTGFGLIEDPLTFLHRDPLRPRGFTPRLDDRQIRTRELVGEFLGLDQDAPQFGSFRHERSGRP